MSDDDATPPISRRRLFLFGAAATALLTAAYAGLRQVGVQRYPELPDDFVVLTRKEAAIFQRLGDYLIPPSDEDDIPGSGGDLATLRALDSMLAELPEHKRSLIRALPLVFEHGTSLDRFGARAMTRMPDEAINAYLDDWADADAIVTAQLWTALKSIYSFTYFERDDVLAAMGMGARCVIPA